MKKISHNFHQHTLTLKLATAILIFKVHNLLRKTQSCESFDSQVCSRSNMTALPTISEIVAVFHSNTRESHKEKVKNDSPALSSHH